MPIFTFESQSSKIVCLNSAKFNTQGILEKDLQTALKHNISAISPDTLVIAEEFGEWDDSKRRIDLLGIDRDGNIVVIELKRDETGAHMELQALRYAAMVSTMTFAQVVDTYQKYLGGSQNAEYELKRFFTCEEEGKEAEFPNGVRIVLAAADFSKELTTAVMWLNQRDLDIRCVRMKPYKLEQRILLDIEQIIPLPEAQDYQVKLKQQSAIQKTAKHEIESKNRAIYLFNNNSYGAGRLVLAVIQKICKDRPDCNLVQLQQLFAVFSSFKVVTTKEEAESIWKKTGHRRHFIKPEEIIKTCNDEELAVSNQWSKDGTNIFISHIPQEWGYKIDIISSTNDSN